MNNNTTDENRFRELQHQAAEFGIGVKREDYPDLDVLARKVSAMIKDVADV